MIYSYIKNYDDKEVEIFFDEFRKIYLNRTNYLKGNYSKIVDKLPDNFLYIGFLTKILPNSKIIRTLEIPGMLLFHYLNKDMLQTFLIAQVFLI